MRYIALRFFVFLHIFMIHCRKPVDDMELIRQFKPDEKYFKAGMMSLHFNIETRSVARVDTLFRQRVNHFDLPVNATGCHDGEFSGTSPADAYDYQHVVKIRIKDEKIVFVDYDEITRDGHGKQHDQAYGEEMSASGTTPAIAYPIYEQALIESQNLMQIDAVSGASYSLYRFRYALVVALMKAQLAS